MDEYTYIPWKKPGDNFLSFPWYHKWRYLMIFQQPQNSRPHTSTRELLDNFMSQTIDSWSNSVVAQRAL